MLICKPVAGFAELPPPPPHPVNTAAAAEAIKLVMRRFFIKFAFVIRQPLALMNCDRLVAGGDVVADAVQLVRSDTAKESHCRDCHDADKGYQKYVLYECRSIFVRDEFIPCHVQYRPLYSAVGWFI